MVDTVSSHVKWQIRNAHSVDGTEQHHADQYLHHLWAPSKQRCRTDMYQCEEHGVDQNANSHYAHCLSTANR